MKCLLALLCLLLGACSTVSSMMGGTTETEAKAAMTWSYAKDAVVLDIQSDPSLNLYDSQPHTLVLGVYQVADPNAFLALLASPAAIGKLLETGQGGQAVLNFERFIVQPQKNRQLVLDRAQNAKYVGVIAGYYNLEPKNVTRLFQIPVAVKTEGMLVTSASAEPSTLAVKLLLGPEKIMNAQQVNFDPKLANTPVKKNKETGEVSITPEEIKKAQDAAKAANPLQQK